MLLCTSVSKKENYCDRKCSHKLQIVDKPRRPWERQAALLSPKIVDKALKCGWQKSTDTSEIFFKGEQTFTMENNL